MVALVVTIIFFVATFLVALISVAIASQIMDNQAAKPSAETQELALAGLLGSTALFKDEEVSSISPWSRFLEKFDFVDVIRTKTAEAELPWTVGRVIAMMLLAGILTLVTLASISWMPAFAVIAFSVVAALTPYFYILHKRSKRLGSFENAFPDAIDSLCRALRAGHPFAAGMDLLAVEAKAPVSTEMKIALDEWKLGLPWNQALDNLAQRVPLTDVAIFVAAVKLQIRTGGKLGEVLGRLAESMRENVAIRGEVRALAAHGKTTGLVLTGMPIFIGLVMFYVNPAQMGLLLQNPTGRNLIAAAVMCLVAAHFVIRKIVDIRL
ncbi:MAG: type II secretion system F family protein [Bryobacteraceae bacterium]